MAIILEKDVKHIVLSDRSNKKVIGWLENATKQCIGPYLYSEDNVEMTLIGNKVKILLGEIPTNKYIITGFQKLIRRAHRKGLKTFPSIKFQLESGTIVTSGQILTLSDYDSLLSWNPSV
jgi:hypothetical protein